ncbi:MAG: T9SS type A sorting domain-containing protein [Sphingobacteriales bacterium]|nr:MAG: T9SS type A sorting domain-containing protein [Sphingobacteriales bacterium]
MKLIIFAAIMFCLFFRIAAQNDCTQGVLYDHIGTNDEFTSMASLDNGEYLFGGSVTTVGIVPVRKKMYFARADVCGGSVWTAAYGQNNESFAVTKIHYQSGSNFFVAAVQYYHDDSGLYSFGLVKLNLSGDTLWVRKYPAGPNNATPQDVIQTTDGGFALVGYTRNLVDNYNKIWFIKTDNEGNMEWDNHFNTNSINEKAKQVIQFPDGGYLLMGQQTDIETEYILLMRTDSQGIPVWERTYGNGYSSLGNHIIPLADGYLIAGEQSDIEFWWMSKGVYLLRIDTEGNILWERTIIDWFFSCSIERVMQLSDEIFICMGNMKLDEGEYDGWLVKINGEGEITWGRTYSHQNTINAVEYFQDFQPTPNGGFLMCGYAFIPPYPATLDAWILRIDSLGNPCPPDNGCWVVGLPPAPVTPLPPKGGNTILTYPNPAKEEVNITFPSLENGKFEWVLYHYTGKQIYVFSAKAGETFQIRTDTFESGMYFYKALLNGTAYAQGKFVIVK